MEDARDRLVPGIKKLGLDPDQIKYVLVTHGHWDHYGGAQYLADTFGARVGLSEADWQLMARLQPGSPARLDRTALHRQLKGGRLGHEDEKFSFVVATRDPVTPAAGRVLRHPVTRKGLVQLEVCDVRASAGRVVVTKRDPIAYRAARDASWGSPWPVPGPEPGPDPGL
jgi:hypothetical protein